MKDTRFCIDFFAQTLIFDDKNGSYIVLWFTARLWEAIQGYPGLSAIEEQKFCNFLGVNQT